MLRLILQSTCLLVLILMNSSAWSKNQLKVTPESCIAKNDVCETIITISWQLQKAAEVCIRITGNSQSIKCFEKNSQTSYVKQVKTNRSLIIELVESESYLQIKKIVLDVFTRKYNKRKRKRHAWSVII